MKFLRAVGAAINGLFLWLFAPFFYVWGEIIGLRGEQIRSLCTVAMLSVLAYALGKYGGEEPPYENGYWLLAALAMVTVALIAWGANYMKAKIAQVQWQAGNSPQGAAPPDNPPPPPPEPEEEFDFEEEPRGRRRGGYPDPPLFEERDR